MDEAPVCDESEVQETIVKKSRLLRKQTLEQQNKKFCAKEERNASIKKVSLILQKSENDRSLDDNLVLKECSDVVDEVQERWRKRDEAKRRLEEYEDSQEVLHQKCQILAQAIAQSQHLVVYTGAGISTAAKIPDYRGPNGIWTRLKEGKEIGDHDLSLAEPTFTHMALFELYRRNILKYVVSQNCDGLHLRSGLPRTVLSEVHGNMYIEVCRNCKPHKEYWRRFDVTESTARFSHKTYRRCYMCNEPLVDSIVHFGERGSLQWPLNWKGACKNAKDATTILCLGSSLKVLKKYPWLWQMDKPAKKRPNLYIINLQWTPKDDCANVKLNGKCDEIMKKIMDILGIVVPKYDKSRDPIFAHASELNDLEQHTTTQPLLSFVKTKKSEVKIENNSKSNVFNVTKDCEAPLDLSSNRDTSDNCDISMDCATLDNVSTDSKPSVFNGFTNQSAAALSFLSYNFLHQQMLNSYSDFFLYPFQTSFLYPGLHSIINPLPVINEEILMPKTDFSATKIEPMCTFCDTNYNSLTCMFYPKYEPVFNNQKYRYSKIEKREKPNACVCCDYTTDEDEEPSTIRSSANVSDQNSCSSSSDVHDSTSSSNLPCSNCNTPQCYMSSSNVPRSNCNISQCGMDSSNIPCANCNISQCETSSSNVPRCNCSISQCFMNSSNEPACKEHCNLTVPEQSTLTDVDDANSNSNISYLPKSATLNSSTNGSISNNSCSQNVNCNTSVLSCTNEIRSSNVCCVFKNNSNTCDVSESKPNVSFSNCCRNCKSSLEISSQSSTNACESIVNKACVNCKSSPDEPSQNKCVNKTCKCNVQIHCCSNVPCSSPNLPCSSSNVQCRHCSQETCGVSDKSISNEQSSESHGNCNCRSNGTFCKGDDGGNLTNYNRGNKVQPGWFGKGYKKGRRVKRKASYVW